MKTFFFIRPSLLSVRERTPSSFQSIPGDIYLLTANNHNNYDNLSHPGCLFLEILFSRRQSYWGDNEKEKMTRSSSGIKGRERKRTTDLLFLFKGERETNNGAVNFIISFLGARKEGMSIIRQEPRQTERPLFDSSFSFLTTAAVFFLSDNSLTLDFLRYLISCLPQSCLLSQLTIILHNAKRLGLAKECR